MGVGFVLLIHSIVIFIISSIIAAIGIAFICIVSKKNKKRKLLFVSLGPFVLLYTFYICALISATIVSEKKKIDIGIGDSWYVPLANNFELLFIDIVDEGHIAKENSGELLVSGIVQIEEKESLVLGKTSGNKYFSYNTKTEELKEFDNEKELIISNSNNRPDLMNVYDFYLKKRDNLAGNWLIVAGIFSLIISLGMVYLLKIILII